jgi:putative transposase
MAGRLWLNDGSCVRLRPEHRDHVWSYDFVHHRTDDGKAFRTLNILDEHSRECLAIRVKRKLNSTEVIDALTDLFMPHAACLPTSAQTTAQSS